MPGIFRQARDPISSYSHFLGAGLSILGLIVMIFRLALGEHTTAVTVVACVLFCLSLIALYLASGTYHFSHAPASGLLILRKLDHAMIYILIAGSYTPVLLSALPSPKNIIFTAAIWAAAAAGITMKLCWISAPRWLGTSLYILMGWAILVDLPALAALPAFEVFFWLRAAWPTPSAASFICSSAPTPPPHSASTNCSTCSFWPAASSTTFWSFYM